MISIFYFKKKLKRFRQIYFFITNYQLTNMSTTLAITIPFYADAMDKRLRHIRTIFAGLGLVVGEFEVPKPYNKDGRELVVLRFEVNFERTDDNEHRALYRLADTLEDIRYRHEDAEAILARVNEYASAKAEYDTKDVSTRGELKIKPLEVVYDSQDHFWKVYKYVPRAPAAAPAGAPPRPRPTFR